MSRHQDYISKARDENKKVWDAIHALLTLQAEYNALDYGNTLPDGEGDNAGYTKDEVGAVVFATADAMKALLDTGHGTNMASLL